LVSTINAWLANHLGLTYLLIVVLTGIIYKTAFDFRLPVLKKVLVYGMLALGCLLLTLFHLLRFPIIPVLAITVVLILVTKMRLRYSRKEEVS
jgi:uncharacterized integral membrane protein